MFEDTTIKFRARRTWRQRALGWLMGAVWLVAVGGLILLIFRT